MQRKLTRPSRATELEQRARILRSALTPSEAALWRLIGSRKLGVQFRRQVVIGHFIADFAASQAGLIVEVDGGYHRERAAADARRDRALARRGYRVLRLEAELVMRQPEVALARIVEALR